LIVLPLVVLLSGCPGVTAEKFPAQPLTIATATLPQPLLQQPYSQMLRATGGVPPYVWSITSGQLPAGLGLNAATGQISGTPALPGPSSANIEVTDQSSQRAPAVLNLKLTVVGPTLDSFGGRMDLACAHATGWFHTEKIGAHWRLCTPTGDAFFEQDVEYAVYNNDSVAQAAFAAKYGSNTQAWLDATLQRLQSWGFNTVGIYSHNQLWPVLYTGTLPIKLPFIHYARPSYYAMRNSAVDGGGGQVSTLLAEPVKEIMNAHSPYFFGYVPPGGIGDYFDPKMQNWLDGFLRNDYSMKAIQGSPNEDYFIGMMADDTDEMMGFESGLDFPTIPPGHNNFNLSLMIISESPIQTANATLGFVYYDTVVHSKKALHDMLEAEYGTIAALDSAWGANYSTFDSSGTQIAGEPAGTGDGSTITFTHTLANLQPSPNSVQIFVAGRAVGGDTGTGAIFGPAISAGSINYSTGSLTITFAPGQAPAAGAAIAVSYTENGWGIGTGLMDEDFRTAHQAWLGNTWDGLTPAISGTALVQMAPAVKTDLGNFLQATAGWYFGMFRTEVKSVFPNALVLGPGLGTWDGVAPAPVLKAAGQYLDVIITGEATSFYSQQQLDFIALNAGDKPLIAGSYRTANADSPLAAFPGPTAGNYPTQQAKGQSYYDSMSAILETAKTSSGTIPHVGMTVWAWMDNWGEQDNWGLVTHLDNAYDAHEDSLASVACSAPISQLTCGGESGAFGDVLTLTKSANALWLTSH
jgi:hypothetical protein